jgi:glycerol-1-phosphate dehydrogenase [NAD(P)+]
LRESYAPARTIRRRYTVLDLVYETGILEACVDELFAPGGFWSPGDRTQPAPEEW